MHDWTPGNKLIRLAIALVWFYQGLWCKVLGAVPRHEAVIAAVPLIGSAAGHSTLIALGLLECGIGLWVWSGRWMRQAAIVQTVLLAVMNAGGLIWAAHLIPDPAGMVLQNFTFLLLIWIANMQCQLETASTSWRRGPFLLRPRGLIFGQTYEDSAIELRVFKPQSRVFAIAGAGCTARVLAAAGHSVTAVDINARQLGYARQRADGEPARRGVVEHLLGFGRNLVTLAGWSRPRLAHFLSLSDGSEQAEYWDRWLDTPMWRAIVDALLVPRLLGLFYTTPFVSVLPRDFGERIRQRLRRGWSLHANRCNPYAAALLLGQALAEYGHPISPINFVCADAAEFLENSPAPFDAFALSNISDGASLTYQRRLRTAVEGAAAPDAVLVTRSFAEPAPDIATNWAALDRSLLWGVVEASRIDGGHAGDPLCSIG